MGIYRHVCERVNTAGIASRGATEIPQEPIAVDEVTILPIFYLH